MIVVSYSLTFYKNKNQWSDAGVNGQPDSSMPTTLQLVVQGV